MAYYLRSDNQPQHGGYMISNSSMQGGYLMHSAKGSEWKKPHKYLDKRWIDGTWKYLYELPKNIQETAKKTGETVKETAKNVGENIQKRHNYAVNEMKKTAEKAVDTVKDTAQKATKAAKDFKDYSKKVDEKTDRLKEDMQQRKDRRDNNNTRFVEAREKQEKLKKEAERATNEREIAEKVYGDKSEAYNYTKNAEDEANKALKDSEKHIKDMNSAYERDAKKIEQDKNKLNQAEAEKESAKYKASKALNAIDDIIDDASGSAKQGLQWLKNQLNSGVDWTTDQIEKIRESDAVASLSGKLENLYANTNSKAAKTGLNIINQLIGWGNLGPVENVSRSSKSSSGRNYSGTGNKAQKREAVAGGPVSDNDYRRRPKR